MVTYTTRAGDTLDWICWRYYAGRQSGAVEAVLDANPHLADVGPVLTAGLVLTLPELEPVPAETAVRLWD